MPRSLEEAEEEIRLLHDEVARLLDQIEQAWCIIANAGGGDWDRETPIWREAAEKWRDRYHRALPLLPAEDKEKEK